MRRSLRVLLTALVSLCFAAAAGAQSSFVTFDTGLVRPLALTPDGTKLLAVNGPDNHLEVFDVVAGGLRHKNSIAVGMEPCAVAALDNDTAYVVNHLSDSVSVVDLGNRRVIRTLLVGDEPRDIVITDPDGAGIGVEPRVFVTSAHRGQHRSHGSISGVTGAGDPELTTQSVPRADVWVFDSSALGSAIGGTPLEIIELFGDTPRALAVSADGSKVYAAVFHSGNKTAVVSEGMVCDGFGGAGACAGDGITSPNGLPGGNLPGGNPGPSNNHEFIAAPEVGLIVQYDDASGEWRDEGARNWSNGIRFTLPDYDVFEIDAATLNETSNFAGVGTILFNMAVNPVSGNVYVSNTDAQNLTRFEGPGIHGSTTVQGNLAQSQITFLAGANVNPRHLNKHINYSQLPAPAGVKDHSLATPVDMVVTSDGLTLYVAAFGSGKVGRFSVAALEGDTFDPTVDSANYVSVSGGGPAGLALDEANDHLFVLTRFDNSISVVDTNTGSEINHIPLHNPEPVDVVEGRPFLYDAFATSSNGEASCSSCHIFGDFDSLAWDLGDPDDDVKSSPMSINLCVPLFNDCSDQNGGADFDEFHPMKGPMTTQTLRGLATSGAMHWRGDRSNGVFGIAATDEEISFKNFIVAFAGLVGRDTTISPADMQKFSDFQLQVRLPPNPVRALDNSLNTDEQAGRDFFFGDHGGNDCADGACILGQEGTLGFSCEGCHTLNPAAGFFGTGGNASFENEEQIFKIAHLRNMYQKVGMFGMPDVDFNNGGNNGHKGDQVRGTGFLHDGSTDTIFRFFQATVFNDNPALNAGFDGGDAQRRDVEAFMLAFDTDLAPIVGQQVTLSAANKTDPDVTGRIALMIARAGTDFDSAVLGGTVKECDLVAKGLVDGEEEGWLYDPVAAVFIPDRALGATLTDVDLQNQATLPLHEVTYTCAPPGSGTRMGIDRDLDGVLDGDEWDAATDPGNPGSLPGACNDGVDNDGDGAFDLADSGCANLFGNIENPECSDGHDNDADGLIDGSDPQCTSPSRNRERPKVCGLTGLEPMLLLGLGRLLRQRRD